MKRLATAAALTLGIFLTGCSSAASVSPSPSPSATVNAGVEGDFRGVVLEKVISKLEAKNVPYRVRILDVKEKYLQNPQAISEQGKWICSGLMSPADGGEIFPRFINVGDTVIILVKPVAT